jgi:8-oxo-dGTP diphosphatase
MKLGRYKHYKNKFYEVVGVALSSEDPSQEFVIYKALYKGDFSEGQLWIRPKNMFLELIEVDGKRVQRFEYVGDVISNQRPKVGVGVYVFNDMGEILIGKRKNAHGEGKWCPPGGHLEFGESFEECAKREALEEANIHIENVSFAGLTNDIFTRENKHYITMALTARWKSGKVCLNEPDKFEKWKWVKWEYFPDDLFLPVSNLRKQINKLLPK